MDPLFAYFTFSAFWLALPLTLAFAFVYAATRHEEIQPILWHTGKLVFWLVGCTFLIFLILYFVR